MILCISSHDVADTSDFLKAMQDVITEEKYNLEYDLNTIMDAWFLRSGYPILNVKRNYTSKTVEIKQQRFYSTDEEDDETITWYIPINIITENEADFNKTKPDFWLTNESVNRSIDVGPEQWILLNKQQTGK